MSIAALAGGLTSEHAVDEHGNALRKQHNHGRKHWGAARERGVAAKSVIFGGGGGDSRSGR